MSFVFKGALRGYADIAVGCMAYELKLWLDRSDDGVSKVPQWMLSLMEITGFLTIALYGIFYTKTDINDFFMVPLAFFSVAISFSSRSFLNRFFQHKIFNWLGIFSLSIYLNHYYVKETLKRVLLDMERHQMMLVYIAVVAGLAVLNYFMGKRLSKCINNIPKLIASCLMVIAVALVLAAAPQGLACIRFGGLGTADMPYKVENRADLEMMRNMVNGGYSFKGKVLLQTENIDLEGEEWIPIGIFNSGNYFQGTYDGGCHYIENLKISPDDGENPANVGLFGMLQGTVKNLGIKSGTVKGSCVGAIASHGVEDSSKIVNCYNMAELVGIRTGGIGDNLQQGTIINCVNFGKTEDGQIAPVISYDAGIMEGIYPADKIPDTFTGKYKEVRMEGKSVNEILNSGLDRLIASKVLDKDEVSYWPTN